MDNKASNITYFDQETAQKFDVELMSEEVGFTLDILMELAGQCVAHVIERINDNGRIKKVMVLAGPGNNGGDGIVSARHLKMMGYDVELALFKETTNVFFKRLLNTCSQNEIPITYELGKLNLQQMTQYLNQYDLLVDGLLGFSYKPPLREPYATVIISFKDVKSEILSIDIPSGWDVEKGNIDNLFDPQYLVSLTLPKLGVKEYKGRHFLGGRFIPEKLRKKYQLTLPNYHKSETFQQLY